jgi:hypothetical protein
MGKEGKGKVFKRLRIDPATASGQAVRQTQDRPFGKLRAGNRYGESRAAVARMKYFGTYATGPSNPGTSRKKLRQWNALLRSAKCKTA